MMKDLLSESIRNGSFVRSKDLGLGNPFVNVTDLYDNFTINMDNLDLAPGTAKEISDNSVLKGDIIFNRTSLVLEGVGHNAYVGESRDGVFFDCHLMRVRPNSDLINSEYMARYCLSKPGRRHIFSRAKTTTMSSISQPDLNEMPIPTPERREQNSKANQMEEFDRLRRYIKRNLTKIEAVMNCAFKNMGKVFT